MEQKKKTMITDEEVEQEIKRLLESPDVRLAKMERRISERRRQYMYSLRCMEKRGKELRSQGVSEDTICRLDPKSPYYDPYYEE